MAKIGCSCAGVSTKTFSDGRPRPLPVNAAKLGGDQTPARRRRRGSARSLSWEIAFWSDRLRRERYAFDEEVLRPYFPVQRVIAGLFELVQRIFGLRVQELAAGSVETWHPEVKFHGVHDARGRHLGSFYADWHPRESKRGGAWMGYLVTGGPTPDGGRAPHLGYICGNLTPAGGGIDRLC